MAHVLVFFSHKKTLMQQQPQASSELLQNFVVEGLQDVKAMPGAIISGALAHRAISRVAPAAK